MRHIKIVICVPYFPILSHKQHDFPKKSVEHKILCFDFYRKLYLKYLSLSENCARCDLMNIGRSASTVSGILLINNQQDASSVKNFCFVTKLYMFRTSSVPITGSYQLYTYQFPRVELVTPGDGHRRCPKHVEFRDKTKILDT
jgi:hypothetical protein